MLTLTSARLDGDKQLGIFSDGDWDETATWNTAPTKSDSRLAFKDLTSTGDYAFDVLAAVRSAGDNETKSRFGQKTPVDPKTPWRYTVEHVRGTATA